MEVGLISVVDLFYWWYAKSIQKIYVFCIGTIKYIYHFFSIPYLIQTLFAPWKRDISSPVNPNIQQMFQAFIDNLIARFVGFIVRIMTIFAGLFILISVFVLLVLLILIWTLFPVLIVIFFINGLYIGFK